MGATLDLVNVWGAGALYVAAQGGHVATVVQLVEAGAKIDLKDINSNGRGSNASNGWTALMAAASSGHKAVVELLLKHGADRVARDNIDGMTAREVCSVDWGDAFWQQQPEQRQQQQQQQQQQDDDDDDGDEERGTAKESKTEALP